MKKSITLIGAGNIGSHLVPHLGRMSNIGRVTLVDRDIYEERNFFSQDILNDDIGKPKALVQAARLNAINPDLHVIPLVEPVENLPLGILRADIILAALDSRKSRQFVNEAAWRLNIPWCDSGVRSKESLARIVVYIPGEEVPCLECAWSDSDYEQIEQVYPCRDPVQISEEPTNAPSFLGALAASLQALECSKVLKGQFDRTAVGRQIVIDTQWHNYYQTRFQRNYQCRFNHKSWCINKLHCNLDRFTVKDALRLGKLIELEHRPFVKNLFCPVCGFKRSFIHLSVALSLDARKCAYCGSDLQSTGFDTQEKIEKCSSQQILRHSFRDIGLRDGDIFHAGNEKYYEIVGDAL